jgi:hypothetical protein
MEVKDTESDIADLMSRTDDIDDVIDGMDGVVDDIDDIVDDNDGRVGYIRQLTAELLEYLQTLNKELGGQVDIPDSTEMMNKIMGRSERKRYYMSKFRL